MIQFFKQRNLSNCSGWYAFVLMVKSDLFDSHDFIGDFISCLKDNPISSFSYLVDALISLYLAAT